MRFIYLQRLLLIYPVVLKLYSGQISKCDNEHTTITSTYCMAELLLLYTALLLKKIYQPAKFLVVTSRSFIVMSGTQFKCKNKQMAIFQTLGKAEIRFLCTALLINEMYLPT